MRCQLQRTKLKTNITSKWQLPNFLILFADDLGMGDLSCYGHPTQMTPNLDKLAAEGIRFTQWYSAFHICTPSRAAMMTGRLPIRSGLAGSNWAGSVLTSSSRGGLPLNETTIAEALKQKNYATMAIGKWHLGQQGKFLPTAQGFDEYYGIPYSDDMGNSAWRPNALDVPLPLLHSTPMNITIVEQPTDLNLLTNRYAAKGVQFIKEKSAAKIPWLLYMAFNHVHTPSFVGIQHCNTTLRGRFGDALAEMDDAIGQIMSVVNKARADENTVVFFTSDNGPWLIQRLQSGSAGLLRDGKTTTWEGGFREPGIIRWKGKIKAGRISTEVVTTYDIFPTSLSLAGISLPSDRHIDGKDISEILFSDTAKTPHECIFYYKGIDSPGCLQDDKHHVCSGLWAVRCGAYKAHFYTRNYNSPVVKLHDPPLIFQIEKDPGESYPINQNTDEYKNVKGKVEAEVSKHKQSLMPVPNQFLAGSDISVAVCCDPDSKIRYPTHPKCTCNPENYKVDVCEMDYGQGNSISTTITSTPRAVKFEDLQEQITL
eukprot:CAMPEP_0204843538 /NCGR_PEP_ID=MMETSP1346-20131115/48035_1 /ASSEMBLY_ACC=CAM_ASM_000771 /TAXON_ID=215587 /ORGANISM="Aplanochytrium stocchinoi, Strain GSBS06" /LENGTH=539 /DNA_ID=CAMNT_0051982695 /DNA_START=190 /DNA_END=1809 /DNA_ORIENTATION=-